MFYGGRRLLFYWENMVGNFIKKVAFCFMVPHENVKNRLTGAGKTGIVITP
jgi:hypothetical protein